MPSQATRPRPKVRPPPAVVYLRDEGTLLDAPVDVVWGFLNWDGHGAAHANDLRNFRVLDEGRDGTTVGCEVMRGGAWRPITVRVHELPPLARVIEEIAGPYAGSQMVLLYTPEGDRTRIDVYARAVSDAFGASELERHWQEALDKAHADDLPLLREYARKARHHASAPPLAAP